MSRPQPAKDKTKTPTAAFVSASLAPKLEEEMSILWKKHQIFSRPAEKFLTY